MEAVVVLGSYMSLLVMAHFIIDTCSRLGINRSNKHNDCELLYIHCFLYSACFFCIGLMLGIDVILVAKLSIYLFFTHILIDYGFVSQLWCAKFSSKDFDAWRMNNQIELFLVDSCAHVIVMFPVAITLIVS